MQEPCLPGIKPLVLSDTRLVVILSDLNLELLSLDFGLVELVRVREPVQVGEDLGAKQRLLLAPRSALLRDVNRHDLSNCLLLVDRVDVKSFEDVSDLGLL